MSIANKARILLIRAGKVLPFIVCLIVFISYLETAFALVTSGYSSWCGYIIPTCSISWLVGQYFEYDAVTLIILLTISVAIETCVWNKLAVLYLAIQLVEKSYLCEIELYPEYIYAICALNLLCSGFLVFKGITILLNKN